MPQIETLTLPTRPATQRTARWRLWGAGLSISLVLLACGAPAQLDLGSDQSALQNDANGNNATTGAGTSSAPTVRASDTGEAVPAVLPDGTVVVPGVETTAVAVSPVGGVQCGAGTQSTGTSVPPAGAVPALDPTTGEPVTAAAPAAAGTAVPVGGAADTRGPYAADGAASAPAGSGYSTGSDPCTIAGVPATAEPDATGVPVSAGTATPGAGVTATGTYAATDGTGAATQPASAETATPTPSGSGSH